MKYFIYTINNINTGTPIYVSFTRDLLTKIWSGICASYKKYKNGGSLKNSKVQKYKSFEYQRLFKHFDEQGIEQYYIFEHDTYESTREKICEQYQEVRSIIMKLKQELNLNTPNELKEDPKNPIDRILSRPASSNKWV